MPHLLLRKKINKLTGNQKLTCLEGKELDFETAIKGEIFKVTNGLGE